MDFYQYLKQMLQTLAIKDTLPHVISSILTLLSFAHRLPVSLFKTVGCSTLHLSQKIMYSYKSDEENTPITLTQKI